MGKKKSKQKTSDRALEESKADAKDAAEPSQGSGGPTGEAVLPLLRLPVGPVDLTQIDPRSTPGFDGALPHNLRLVAAATAAVVGD